MHEQNEKFNKKIETITTKQMLELKNTNAGTEKFQ